MTPYSQGPGNFRDVNQNRRLDVLINPNVKDFNVRMFLSFVQADGFNVLTVAGTNFRVPPESVAAVIDALSISNDSVPAMSKLLSKSFRIGQLFSDMAGKVKSTLSKDEMLHAIMTHAVQEFAGSYNQNGYWSDHWTYTQDLIDNFLAVYPDMEEHLLFDSEPVPFFFSPAVVKPRAQRYIPMSDFGSNLTRIRVYSAVMQREDPHYPDERRAEFSNIIADPDFMADQWGQGGYWQRSSNGTIFKVSPISKLIMLAVNKFSSLDQSGMGVEMEGGKPGWNDAMNGLPGIIGSGMPETYEMLRILNFAKDMLTKHPRSVSFPEEFAQFLASMLDALNVFGSDDSDSAEFRYWNASNDAREAYRDAVLVTFSGKVVDISANELVAAISLMQEKTQMGINKALATTGGLSPTYFYHECVDFEVKGTNPVTVIAKKFVKRDLPLFLEGPARHLKVISDVKGRRDVYARTKASTLYDSFLKMYKISESLRSMDQEVGRMKAFSPGWLENESIWLHMSYKFYLELLRGGLYEEFFHEIATGLVPFMPPEVYGRNPVEASSFIVSSAFPDPTLYGSGFLARLSGSTAEFLSMWSIMMMGKNPFVVGFDGKLSLSLRPIIPGWMFTKENTVSFMFLSTIKVTYHNPTREDTWKILPKSATVMLKSKEQVPISTPLSFPEDLALKVRNREVTSIDIEY